MGNDIFMATKFQTKTSQDVNILYALNKQNGKIRWTFHMWGITSSFSEFEGVPSAPIISGDTLYIISGNEMLYAISYAD